MGKKDFKPKSSTDRNVEVGAVNGVTQTVDAPEARYQDKQTVEPVSSAVKTETVDSNLIPKTVKSTGGELKQEVASQIVTGKGFGSGASDVASASSYGFKNAIASGEDARTILGNASGTPVANNPYQGNSRVEKKLSDPNKDINFLACEQVLVEYDQIPSLAENPSSPIGRNGNPKNNALRLQKNSGASSAEEMYDRSLDYIVNSSMVFAVGQTVKQDGVNYQDYPTKTAEGKTFDTSTNSWNYPSYSIVRGNYTPSELVVTLDKDSQGVYVKSFQVISDDISCNHETADSVNRSATHERIFINKTEMIRQTIDDTEGSPTSEHFNPLGRSVKEPTATVALLHDIEASTGATVFAALRSALKARSYYLFRTRKDGQDDKTPAIEALYGHLMSYKTSTELATQFNNDRATGASDGAFNNKTGINAGSAALLMSLWDSMGKYNNKADINTQTRGLKMALQTGLNSYAPFHVYPNFVKAFNDVDVFSTIDRGYDPMAPICASDAIRLVYPYDLSTRFGFTRNGYNQDRNYTSELLSYDYAAGSGQNFYKIKVTDPLLAGIAYFFELNAFKLYNSTNKDSLVTSEHTIRIPMIHYGMHFGLWDYLICAALPYIIYERTNVFKDILDYEKYHGYPFDDLVSLVDAHVDTPTQYSGLGLFSALSVGQMTDSTGYRWIMPEVFLRIGSDYTMMPWYISSADYTLKGSKLTFNDGHNFNAPNIRSGIRLATLTKFYNASLEDRLLTLDRVTTLPLSDRTTLVSDYVEWNGLVYKYSQDSEGQVVINNDDFKKITLKDFYSTPRQLGWIMPGYQYATGVNTGAPSDYFCKMGKLSDFTFINTPLDYTAIMYKGVGATSSPVTLDVGVLNVDRGQSFTQMWTLRKVSGTIDSTFDLPLSISDYVNGTNLTTYAQYTPFINSEYKYNSKNVETGVTLCSLHNAMWSIIQKVPFLINPFDWNAGGLYIDPFMLPYTFGLAGWDAADYEEMDYNRVNLVQSQSYGYTSDPFINASPLFK